MIDETMKNIFVEVADECDLEFRSDYSGRFMYGVTTYGVVGNWQQLFRFLQILGMRLNESDIEDTFNFTFDNMGLDMILYIK